MPAPAIEAINLTKFYGKLKAVDNVSFTVENGELFGLLGPNGAGKTTTVLMICGLLKPTSGEVHVKGLNVQRNWDRVRKLIGISFQDTMLYEKLTVEETLMFFARVYGLSYGKAKENTEKMIKIFELEAKRKTLVEKLSGGLKRRLHMAASMVHDPELLLLDEPTLGLDPQARRRIWEVLEQIREYGKSILLTTHYMDEADRLCDRVAIIDHGKIIALDSPSNLKTKYGEGDKLTIMVSKNVQAVAENLGKLDFIKRVDVNGKEVTIVALGGLKRLGEIVAAIQNAGSSIENLSVVENTLEDVFIALTGRRLRD